MDDFGDIEQNISGWKEDVWNLFSLSAARGRERGQDWGFSERLSGNHLPQNRLSTLFVGTHQLTDSRTSRLDTRSDTPPISILWCSSLKQRVCSQPLLFQNKFNDEDFYEGEMLQFPVAHRCTIFLCIWDGKYSTGWGPPIGGGRSEMRLQRPKYTKLDLVFCKMYMP